MLPKRPSEVKQDRSYIEVRLIAVVTLAVVLTLLVLPMVLRALDLNGDNLDDTWEAQYGITTNAYASTNLVGWWQLNGTNNTDNAVDRSGNGINGTLSNFPSAAYGAGLYSNALYFTTNTFVNFPTTNSVLNATNQFTFSAWFQSTNNMSQPATVVTWSDAETNGWSVAVGTNGAANITFFDGATLQTVTGTSTNLYDGGWHQVAATYDTNQLATVYVDGTSESTNTITGWTPGAVASFVLGTTDTNTVNNPFKLDEARLYNRALGANEVPLLPVTYTDLNGTGLTVFDNYLEGLDPFSTSSIVTSGFASSGLTAYYGSANPVLTKTGGNAQTVSASTFATNALVVHVANTSGTALVGAPITFSIPWNASGGIALTSGGTITTSLSLVTDASGNATVYYKSGPEALQNNTIIATAVSAIGSTSTTFTEYCGVQSGLSLWLRADAGVTTDGSGNVSAWSDQSASGNNAAQATSTIRPGYLATGLIGKQCLHFTGSNYLSIPDSASLRPSGSLTIFAVAKENSTQLQQVLICRPYRNTSPWATPWLSYYAQLSSASTSMNLNMAVTTGSSATITGTNLNNTYDLSVPHQFSFRYTGSTQQIYAEGGLKLSLATSGALNYAGGSPNICIGAHSDVTPAEYLIGDVSEILFYNRALTDTERQQVEVYLANKYGLYNTSATWPSGYSSAVQSLITAHQWNKSQADAYVAFLGSSQPIPTSGLVTWLEADTGVTSSSGKVSAWADQSLNGNNAVQATSTSQPTLVTSAINGKPALSFSGTNFMSITDNASLRPSNITIIAAATLTSAANYDQIASKPYYSTSSWSAPYQTYALWYAPNNIPYSTSAISGTEWYSAGTAVNLGQACVLSATYTGTAQQLARSGTVYSSAITGAIDYGDATRKDVVLGGNSTALSTGYLHGQIAEVLIYNRALTSTERIQAEVYLADKYGLYHPNATWSSTYPSDVQSEITRNKWNKSQADAYVTFAASLPPVPPLGLVTWLKADAGVTQSSGKVSGWADQSPNGNNAVQATSANQPTFTTNAINGQPALTFNGTSSYMAIPDNSSLRPANATMIAVAILSGGTGYEAIVCKPYFNGSWNSPYEAYALFYVSGTPFGTYALGGVNRSVVSSQAANLGEAYIWSTAYNGITETLVHSGATYSNSFTGSIGNGDDTRKDLAIGVESSSYLASYLNGKIAEVLFYNRVLTDAELKQVGSYLAVKYGLPYGGDAPTISPNGGSATGTQAVTITSNQSTGTLHYTLDGTVPTVNSPTYSSTITLASSALVSAQVFNSTGTPLSVVGSAQFYVNDTGSTGLPPVPGSLTVTNVSSGENDLNWSLSGLVTYSQIYIYRSDNGGSYNLIAVVDPSSATFADTTAVAGTSYSYEVGTVNRSGIAATSGSTAVTPGAASTLSIDLTAPAGAITLP